MDLGKVSRYRRRDVQSVSRLRSPDCFGSDGLEVRLAMEKAIVGVAVAVKSLCGLQVLLCLGLLGLLGLVPGLF